MADLDARAMLRKLARSPDLLPFRELVEPLAHYDREQASFLIRTLRAYFASGESASEAAERLFLHRNSVPYRLNRISELTGLDWRDPQARLALKLGLLALDEEGENEVKISTRNRLPGRITEVVKGEAAATVGLQVGENHMVCLITRESAEELGLEADKEVIALIKATDIMILTDDEGLKI